MHIVSRVLGTLIAACSAQAHAAETITFDTLGGDAWQLELPISGTFDATRCDQIVVQSPRASMNATVVAQHFFVTVPLQNGDNPLQAFCRRQDRTLARAREQTWHLALADTPKARARVRIDGRNVVLNANGSERVPLANVPIVTREWYAEPGNPTQLTLADGSTLDEASSIRKNEIPVVAPPRDGEYYIRLQVTDALGQRDVGRTVFRVANGEAQTIAIAEEHPAWLDSAVVYGAAPYMFTPQSFSGVRERMDEIAALGATAIWLSPVSQAAPDDFGYSVTDQFAFRDDFGDEREFRAPEFWPLLRAELKRIDPDIVLIAEASAREPYHVANGFDGAYDWTLNLDEWAWRDVFGAGGAVDVPRLRRAITNDDKEQGAQFSPYDEGPPIAWQDNALTAHYRRLAMLRRDVAALRTRAMQMVRTRNDQDVLAYLRPAQPGSTDALVLLNFSARDLDVTPDGTSEREIFGRFAAASDILNDVPIRFSSRRPTVHLPAKSAASCRSCRSNDGHVRQHNASCSLLFNGLTRAPRVAFVASPTLLDACVSSRSDCHLRSDR